MSNKFVSENYINSSLNKTKNLISNLLKSKLFLSSIIESSDIISKALKQNNFIFLAGNGGSAAQAQHFAAELVSRFNFDRNPLPAISLTTDSSILTAISNDYGFAKVFERQLEGLSKKGDIFIGLSTSGNSENIINAFHKAKELKLKTIAISGENGIKDFSADLQISIPSKDTPLIQEMHCILSHLICDLVEKTIFKEPKKFLK